MLEFVFSSFHLSQRAYENKYCFCFKTNEVLFYKCTTQFCLLGAQRLNAIKYFQSILAFGLHLTRSSDLRQGLNIQRGNSKLLVMVIYARYMYIKIDIFFKLDNIQYLIVNMQKADADFFYLNDFFVMNLPLIYWTNS